MSAKRFILVGLLFGVLTAWATEIITRSGVSYRDCTVSKVDPDGISVLYTNGPVGGAKLKFTDLPEDLQKQYGYDPAKAAEFEKEEQARMLRATEAEKEAIRLALLHQKSHSQTNQVSSTNTTTTNQVSQARQPKTTVQHHPQHVVRPRGRVIRPPAVHVPAQRPPPVQHHPPAHGKTQSLAA